MLEKTYKANESGITTVQKQTQKNLAIKGRKQVGVLSSADRGQPLNNNKRYWHICSASFCFPTKKNEEQTDGQCFHF